MYIFPYWLLTAAVVHAVGQWRTNQHSNRHSDEHRMDPPRKRDATWFYIMELVRLRLKLNAAAEQTSLLHRAPPTSSKNVSIQEPLKHCAERSEGLSGA